MRLPLVALLAAATLAVPLAVHAGQWKDALKALQQAAGPQASGDLAALSDTDIASGLREALAQGTRAAVSSLGRSDGFWANAAARIPMPTAVQNMERTLRGVGMGGYVDQFHLSLNRAAEQAVPVAADVFANAARKLTVADARAILTGGQDSATQYFRRTAGDALALKFLPLVRQATSKVGVAQSYKQMTAAAGPFSAALGAPSDLDGYVTQKALDSLFLQVAAEEKRIRENPAARGTALLKKVFGSAR